MRWILDLDILLIVSGIARKHGIMPKPFLGRPQYFPPPFIGHVRPRPKISQEREFVASQIGNYKKMFLIVQTYLGGQSLCSPHLAPQIQSLPELSNRIKVNEFAGLLNVFYIRGSTKINA
jgi:hypothetical protein